MYISVQIFGTQRVNYTLEKQMLHECLCLFKPLWATLFQHFAMKMGQVVRKDCENGRTFNTSYMFLN